SLVCRGRIAVCGRHVGVALVDNPVGNRDRGCNCRVRVCDGGLHLGLSGSTGWRIPGKIRLVRSQSGEILLELAYVLLYTLDVAGHVLCVTFNVFAITSYVLGIATYVLGITTSVLTGTLGLHLLSRGFGCREILAFSLEGCCDGLRVREG